MPTAGDYDAATTELCERALVTVIGSAGFWGRHLYLVGGLVPRYLIREATGVAVPHVGTRDLDLAIALALGSPHGSYETLERNLRDLGFRQAPEPYDPEFRWRRDAEGQSLVLEFLCDTDEVLPGRNFKPKSGAGSRFQALNVPGVRCLEADHQLVEIEADRFDGSGRSKVMVRVAGLMSFVMLKIRAFIDRHHDKDSYDLVYMLLNHPEGPVVAGRTMAHSAVASHPLVLEAIEMLRERYADAANDAPAAYARFLAPPGAPEAVARLRLEAVETVRLALQALDRYRIGGS